MVPDKCILYNFLEKLLKEMIMSFGLGLGIHFPIEPWSFWRTGHGKNEGGKDLSGKSVDSHSTNLVIAEEKMWTSGKLQYWGMDTFGSCGFCHQ